MKNLKAFILILVILSFISLHAVAADDIYVNPEATGNGTGTLDDPYSNIQLAIDNVGDNSTINLMPGTYSGKSNSDLTVNANNLTITSYHGQAIFTPAENSAPTRYFNITGKNVVLNGLTFISGVSMSYKNAVGGDVVITADNVVVNNTKFIDSISQGGALYVTSSNTVIENSLFRNNTATVGEGGAAHVEGGNLKVINTAFTVNSVKNGAGGAFFFIGENLLVDTSNFTANNVSARKGGAIYAEAANVKIISSRFINQTANSANGGAVYIKADNLDIDKSVFDKNTANGGFGGALKFNGTNLTINKSNFTNNVVQGKDGASIYSQASNLVTIKDSYFDSNKAWNGAGGAIYNTGDMMVVDNSEFTNQITTTRNGAGVIYMNGSLNVTDSNFTKNYGYTGVGAVHQLNGDLYINNTLFDSNQGWNLNGGAVCMENSNFMIENSNFTSNTAGSSGGAIYGDNSKGTIQDNIFDKNLANNGAGAVHLIGDNFTIQRNNFSNGARYSVGFIILKGNNNTVDECNFDHGYSQNSIGGAIASYGENLTVTNCNMNDIDTPSVGGMIYSKGNNTFIENCSLNDSETVYGVIFIEGDNPVINNISMSYVRTNIGAVHLRSNNATVTNSTFYKCQKSSYGNGGVIFWRGTDFGPFLSLDKLTVENCTFIDCNGEGGYNTAVSAYGTNVLVNDSDFINCSSPYCGAVMFRGTNATIINSNFDGCEGEVYAGAISMAGSNVTVEKCNFTNNWAGMYGGAIYTTASNATIKNNLFVNNTVGSDGSKQVRGKTYPLSYRPGDGGSIMIDGGNILTSSNNVTVINNIFCNASIVGCGGAIENRARAQLPVYSENIIYNINVTLDGGGVMNYGYIDEESTITDCHAGRHGHDIYNVGLDGPVYMILDQTTRYLYVNETTFIPIGLVNQHNATITVPTLQGLVTDETTGRMYYHQFNYNEAGDNNGFETKFEKTGVYIFKPFANQQFVFLAADNILTIYVVDRMPVKIELPEIRAYPGDTVDYTFNVTTPDGVLIRNGTVWMVINNHNFTAEILNGNVDITDHDLTGNAADVKYSEEYKGNITLRNVQLYDDAKKYNVTAYYKSNCNYYMNTSQNGTINILPFETYIPEIRIDAYVRDQVTFTIDVKSESGRIVEGNVSFYLPYVLAEKLESSAILNSSKFGEYDGILFTVKIRESMTLTIPVESEFRLPIFYYGNSVFAPSQGLLNISTHRNPTQVLAPVIYAEVGIPFDVLINVTSKYTVDENVVRVIFADTYTDSEGNTVDIQSHFYDVQITEGNVSRVTTLYMPGVYTNPVIYTGGPSFLSSSNVTVIIVALVNLTVAADDITTFPGDIQNITVNLTDKYGNKVMNGTVNTTINGITYFADVTNGTATFRDVLLGEDEGEFEYTVYYGKNKYYNDANTTASISIVKINTDITASDIEGLPGDDKQLNITLKDEFGNVLNLTVKVTYPDGTEENIDLSDNSSFVLPNPGDYEITVNYTGSVKYNPSDATIHVTVSPLITAISADNITGYPKELVNVTVNITDEKGNHVMNGTARIMVSDKPYYADVVNGSATFVSVELPKGEGKYASEVDYTPIDNYYCPSQTIINITVAKIDSNTQSENAKGRTGEKINITANITDINGNPISEGTATLTFNGTVYTANVTDGRVVFEGVVLPNPGNYTVDITYNGDDIYNPSNTAVNVSVSKIDSNITSDSVNGYPHQAVDITADVTDVDGNLIPNGTAVITVDGTDYYGEVNNGVVIFNGVVLPEEGNFSAPIRYEGTDIYNPSDVIINISVSKIDSDITSKPVSTNPNEKFNVTANITDADGNPILNGTATLTVNGTEYTAPIINGTATFENVSVSKQGNYTGIITYPGSDVFNPSNTEIDISVLKLDTSIVSEDVWGYPSERVDITANITDENGNPVMNGTAVMVIGDKIGEAPKGLAAAGEYVATVSNGKAVFKGVVLPDPGVYPADLMYLGDDLYNPSNSAIKINVLKMDSKVTSEDIPPRFSNLVNVTANVTDINGNPVEKGSAVLTINGTDYTASIINGSVTFENVYLPVGSHTGIIVYPGDDKYNPSNTTVSAEIKKINVEISPSNVGSAKSDDNKVTVTIPVIDDYGNPVQNGVARFIVGGKEYITEVHDGVAKFEDVVIPENTTEAVFKYDGNDEYAPIETTVDLDNVTVTQDNTTSDDENQTVDPEDDITEDDDETEEEVDAYAEQLSESEASESPVNHSVDSRQTGNPVLMMVLVCMLLISNTIFRRKK